MICDFNNDNIVIVIFILSGSNNHKEQIYSLIGPVSTNSAERMKQIFSFKKPVDGYQKITIISLKKFWKIASCDQVQYLMF